MELPSSIDMERAVIGSVLMNRDAMTEASAILPSAADFYDERHILVWQAMLDCFARRTPPDLALVVEELRRAGKLESVGGVVYLMEATNATVTSYHIASYAQSVAEAAARRRAIEASSKIAAMAYDEQTPVRELHGKAQAEIDAALVRLRARGGASLAQIMSAKWEDLKEGVRPGIPTGYRDVDELFGGLQRSDLIILAARPRVGKTSFAMCVAKQVAKQDKHVMVFSLEMSREQLGDRLLSVETGIDSQRIRLRMLRNDEPTLLAQAMSELSRLNIQIEDDAALSVSDVRARALRESSINGPLDLIIVDYLQLMRGTSSKGDNRVQEVSEISRGLKQLARELNVPIIALSQLSRAVEGRTSHVPMLSDLRESGSLEQDADIVIFIYREEIYDSETDKKGVAEMHVAKHRHGPCGVIPMRYEESTTRFTDLTYRSPEGY